MRGVEHDQVQRALARHQYVRDLGHPRVSTLVGDPAVGAAAWSAWLRGGGLDEQGVTTFAQPADADRPGDGRDPWLERAAGHALSSASGTPARPIAILVSAPRLAAWLAARHDRLATFVAEGAIDLPTADPPLALEVDAGDDAPRHAPGAERPRARAAPAPDLVAARLRSAAEAAMLAALEADPTTRGRFQPNQPLSFAFGDRATEVDLLSRGDDIVVEIDGYHHFTDLEHYRRDRRKDLLLQAHGYTVLRFLAEDVMSDARAAVAAVVELMGVRRGHAHRARRS